MQQKSRQPRLRRRFQALWPAALVALLFVGSSAAGADHRHDDGYRDTGKHARSDRHRHQHGPSCQHQRYRDHRYDGHRRQDQYRHNQNRYRHNQNRYRHNQHRDDHGRYNHGRYNHGRYNHGRYRANRYNHGRTRHFDVPRAIVHDRLHAYHAYRHGRLYHAGHRHYHEIYRFPVYSEYNVEYYPYAYCEGNFFGQGVFRDGRAVFDLRIRF